MGRQLTAAMRRVRMSCATHGFVRARHGYGESPADLNDDRFAAIRTIHGLIAAGYMRPGDAWGTYVWTGPKGRRKVERND